MIDVERLVAFLEAEIAEDERIARAALARRPGRWEVVGSDGEQIEIAAPDEWDIVVYAEGRPLPEQAGHIVRHEPLRVLRRVEGFRQIIARFEDAVARTSDLDHSTAVAELQAREYEDYILPALAASYVGRDGFDPSWLSEEAK